MHLVLIDQVCLFPNALQRPSEEGLEDILLASTTILTSRENFDGKSQTARDLFDRLVEELTQLGPFQKTNHAVSISFENRRPFAWVLIRKRSLKLVLRTPRRIINPRILGVTRVDAKYFDHTILLESLGDFDAELMKWLGDAYHANE